MELFVWQLHFMAYFHKVSSIASGNTTIAYFWWVFVEQNELLDGKHWIVYHEDNTLNEHHFSSGCLFLSWQRADGQLSTSTG